MPTDQLPCSVLVLLITAECVWYNNLFLYTVIAIYWNSICSGGRKKEGVRYCNFISHITVYAHNYSKRYWRHNTTVYFPPTHMCGDKQQFLFVYAGICMCVGSLWTDIRLYVVLKYVCPHLALNRNTIVLLSLRNHNIAWYIVHGGRYQSFNCHDDILSGYTG